MPGRLLVGVIVAALLMLGGMAVLGLPGGIYSLIAAPLAEVLRGMPAGSLIEGERAWPVAIMMTLAVPPVLPVMIGLTSWLRPRAGLREATAWVLGGIYLWAVLVMVVLA